MKNLVLVCSLFLLCACSTSTERGDKILIVYKKNEKTVENLNCKSLGTVKLGAMGQSYGIGVGDGNMDRLRTRTADEGGNVLVTNYNGDGFKQASGVAYNCTSTALVKLRESGDAY